MRPHTAELGQLEGTDTFRDLDRNEDARLIDADPPATALVIDAEGVSDIDTTAVQQLDELLDDLETAEVTVRLARVREPARQMLERSGVLARIGEDVVFFEVGDAVADFRSRGS